MRNIHHSKAAQLGLIVAILAAVTIGADSRLPLASAIVWLPAVYVAIYHGAPGRRSHGQRA